MEVRHVCARHRLGKRLPANRWQDGQVQRSSPSGNRPNTRTSRRTLMAAGFRGGEHASEHRTNVRRTRLRTQSRLLAPTNLRPRKSGLPFGRGSVAFWRNSDTLHACGGVASGQAAYPGGESAFATARRGSVRGGRRPAQGFGYRLTLGAGRVLGRALGSCSVGNPRRGFAARLLGCHSAELAVCLRNSPERA
jgi:hypothetical protein